jgi:hypothetical protein
VRAHHRVLKLTRTFTKWAQSFLADLTGEAEIRTEHEKWICIIDLKGCAFRLTARVVAR